jgi:signal transduction histidine kinase/ligand-binding sensor domain-containing protein
LRSGTPRSATNLIAAASVILLASLVDLPACADPYVPRLTQYGHRAWHVQDGLFNGPNSITQTKDGYLWLGTDSGLVRFDGVRFVPWNSFASGSIADWSIDQVLAARDGSLWIGAQRHLAHLTDKGASLFDIPGRAIAMVEDNGGAIWFARSRILDGSGPVCSVIRSIVACYGKPEHPFPTAESIILSNGDGLWLGSSFGLCRWLPGKTADCYLQAALRPLNGLSGVEALLTTRDGALWVGIRSPGKDLGLGKLIEGKWRAIEAKGLNPSKLSVTALFEDRDGSVWVGTADQGIYRIRAGVAEHFGLADGLSAANVTNIYQDREGIIWVCTSGGLDAFRRLPVTIFSTREGLPADDADAVLPTRDGSVWVSNSVLTRLVDDVPGPPSQHALLSDRAVTSMLEDKAGRLWIGLNKTLNVFADGTLTPVKALNGEDLGIVTLLAQDTRDDVWAVTAESVSRIFRIRGTTVTEEFDAKNFGVPIALAPDSVNGVWFGYSNGSIAHYYDGQLEMFVADSVTGGPVRALLPQADGLILAPSSKGLLVKRDNSRLLLSAQRGLPCERLTTALRDLRNALWLSSRCGLIEIEDADLKRWLAAPSGKIRYRLFDETDGVQSGTADFSPRAKMDRDGRLWFATSKVVQMIDPKEVSQKQSLPVVKVEQVIADRKILTQTEALALPVRTRDIEIQYTALSFLVPQKIRFKYQLIGHDKTLIDAGTRRAAFYNDLPPGRYLFKVIACNSDGVWNNDGASLSFEIPPMFYQTGWFRALCLIAALSLFYLLYLARIRQIAAQIRGRLITKNAERERIARELHDTLLQSTQGLILRFQAATQQLPADNSVRVALELVLQRAGEVMVEGRDRVQDLRTSDSLSGNLMRSLSLVGEQLAHEYKIEFRAVLEGLPRDLNPTVGEESYAIGREALLNAFTHSQARVIEAQVIYSDADFRLRFRDDGRGINTEGLNLARPGHFGLKGMRERAQRIGAELEIWSRPNAGTELELKVPATLAYAKRRARFDWRSFRHRAQD